MPRARDRKEHCCWSGREGRRLTCLQPGEGALSSSQEQEAVLMVFFSFLGILSYFYSFSYFPVFTRWSATSVCYFNKEKYATFLKEKGGIICLP